MANTFGDAKDVVDFLNSFKSLFGGQGDRVPTPQSFSSQPAQENLSIQNASALQAALDNLRVSKEASSYGAGLSSQGYQDKLNADYNQAVKAKNLNQNAGGGADIVGRGAFTSPQRLADPYGMSGFAANFQGMRDFGDRQNMAAQSEGLFGAIAARNEGERVRQINNAQLPLEQAKQNMQIDLMNRQSSLDTQNRANDFYRQRELSAQQQASSERLAGIQAQGNILSSLFGSVSAGSPNYRYWG